ncbi:MAG: Re/Si-specific NAD(P)(+) transhydrogenase subunit alpha [Bdellovibrionales bacterium]
MRIAVLKERRAHEARVAATPETVKKLIALGYGVMVETGAGAAAAFTDAMYRDAGAEVVASPGALLGNADIVLKVQRPMTGIEEIDELGMMRAGSTLIAMLNPFGARDAVAKYAQAGIDAYALELVPRITRAQNMDVLSSQANLAGYKAVLLASNYFPRAFPMMMTAAGTVPPANVLIMGAGVAGLQAIATAKRLGAKVSATDVRIAAKEQVESLGGMFVLPNDERSKEELKNAETSGGYAKEMSPEFKQAQAAMIAEVIKKQDIVITTALIPGRAAPRLVTADMVASMKTGSVIVDMAVEQGGNCELSRAGEVITSPNGVVIVGHLNIASLIAADASALYARNILHFLTAQKPKEGGRIFAPQADDEIIKAMCLTRGGQVVHDQFR